MSSPKLLQNLYSVNSAFDYTLGFFFFITLSAHKDWSKTSGSQNNRHLSETTPVLTLLPFQYLFSVGI